MKTALSYGLCAVFLYQRASEGSVRFGQEFTAGFAEMDCFARFCRFCTYLQDFARNLRGCVPGFCGDWMDLRRRVAESVRGLRLREVVGFREMFCGLLSVFSELL